MDQAVSPRRRVRKDAQRIREAEKYAMALLKDLSDEGIEILNAIRLIKKKKMVPNEICKYMFDKYSTSGNSEERFDDFVKDIKGCVPYSQFVLVLQTLSGKKSRNCIGPEYALATVPDKKYATNLQRYFSILKSLMDNNSPNDRIQFCERQARQLLENADRMPVAEHHERQWAYDKYVTVKTLYIQHLRDKTVEDRLAVLDEMMTNIPHDIDKTYARLVVQCKKATSNVNAGNITEAENFMTCALQMVHSCSNSFLKILAYYDGLYVFRSIHTQTREERYMDKIADMCDRGMDTLEKFTCSDTDLWERLLLLHMAQTYLGIDIDLEINYAHQLSCRNKFAAKTIVKQLARKSPMMESRREMFLQLCQTRIYEEDDDIDMAVACITRALVLADDGAYYLLDKQRIEAYQRRLYIRALPIGVSNAV